MKACEQNRSNLNWRDVERVSDPETNPCLLPESLCPGSNRDEVMFMRLALRLALRECLNEKQREAIQLLYWEGCTRTEVARRWQMHPSSISKLAAKAQKILERQVDLSLRAYRAMKEEQDRDPTLRPYPFW